MSGRIFFFSLRILFCRVKIKVLLLLNAAALGRGRDLYCRTGADGQSGKALLSWFAPGGRGAYQYLQITINIWIIIKACFIIKISAPHFEGGRPLFKFLSNITISLQEAARPDRTAMPPDARSFCSMCVCVCRLHALLRGADQVMTANLLIDLCLYRCYN